MFGISGAELMVVLLLALIVLGPDRLPTVARKAGQVIGELRKVSSGFEAEMRTAMFEADNPERYRPSSPIDTSEAPPQSDRDGDPTNDPADPVDPSDTTP